MNIIDEINQKSQRSDLPDFRAGDTVKVNVRVTEGGNTRIQVFQGVVIARHGTKQPNATFTVRKVSFGIGVERTFPVNSPTIESLEVVTRGDVRRANSTTCVNVTEKPLALESVATPNNAILLIGSACRQSRFAICGMMGMLIDGGR